MLKYGLLSILFVVSYLSVVAQAPLYGISTEENDSFKEWIIYTNDEDEEGELDRTWRVGDNWTDWEYRLGETSGDIKIKWKNDPNSPWELRGDGETISMRTKWRGDFTEWRISNGSITLTLEAPYPNQREEWNVKETKHGTFQMYTTREGDVRDWDIVDEMNSDVSFHMKMAMVFIVMYHSTPKF